MHISTFTIVLVLLISIRPQDASANSCMGRLLDLLKNDPKSGIQGSWDSDGKPDYVKQFSEISDPIKINLPSKTPGCDEKVTFGFDMEMDARTFFSELLRNDREKFEKMMRSYFGKDCILEYQEGMLAVTVKFDPYSTAAKASGLRDVLESRLSEKQIDNIKKNGLALSSSHFEAYIRWILQNQSPPVLYDDFVRTFTFRINELTNEKKFKIVPDINGRPEIVYSSDDGKPFSEIPKTFWEDRIALQKMLNPFVGDWKEGYPHDHFVLPKDFDPVRALALAQAAEAWIVLNRLTTIFRALSAGKDPGDFNILGQYFRASTFVTESPNGESGRGLVRFWGNRPKFGHDIEVRTKNDKTKNELFAMLAAIVTTKENITRLERLPYRSSTDEKLDPKIGAVLGTLRFYRAAAAAAQNKDLSTTFDNLHQSVKKFYESNGETNLVHIKMWKMSLVDEPEGVRILSTIDDLVKGNSEFFSNVNSYLLGKKP